MFSSKEEKFKLCEFIHRPLPGSEKYALLAKYALIFSFYLCSCYGDLFNIKKITYRMKNE